MKRFTSMLVFLAFLGSFLYAQDIQITGKVTTSEDGSPLPGVNVVIQGTTDGTITDIDGNYSIEAPPDATLIYSSLGMETQGIPVGGQTVIDVSLVASSTQMEEVVVTAFGISKQKKGLGYAATTVSGDEIAEANVANPMGALQGKVAGVDITTSPGQGSTINVMIRGASSLGSNQPLYVIDGVPITNGQNRMGDNLNFQVDFGSGINAINPNDIESMTILAGAAATAKYGSRAANGVIMVTTKKGKNTDGKMNVDFNSAYSFYRIGMIAERQDMFGQGWSGEYALDENGNWGPQYTGEDRVYGFEIDGTQMIKPYAFVESRIRDFYDIGNGFSNSLSLSGGTDVTNYYFSFSNDNEDGVYPDDVDTYDRYTLSGKGEHNWKRLTIGSSVNYSNELNRAVPSGQGSSVYRSLWEIAEDYSVVDMKDYNSVYWNLDNYFTPYGVNPYFALYENGSEQTKNKFFGSAYLNLEILEGLTAMYRFGGDYESSVGEAWIAKIAFSNEDVPSYNSQTESSGSYTMKTKTRYELNHDMLLNYNSSFGKLNVDVLAGINVNERGYNYLLGEVTALDVPGYYNLDNGTSDPVSEQYKYTRRLFGILGTVDLNYNDIYYLSLTARQDKSSTLPLENNTYFYPGATFAFNLAEFLNKSGHSISFLDFAKFRVAYGLTGNDADPYQVYAAYESGYSTNPGYPDVDDLEFPLNGLNSWTVSNQLGSEDLQPEITSEFEVGTELYFFKKRFGLEFSYYDRFTEGFIYTQPIDPSSGYTSIVSNLGDVSNKGFELMVSVTPIRTNDFEWNMSANYSENHNMVVSLSETEVTITGFGDCYIVAIEGKELGTFKTYTEETVTIDGEEYTVVDGDGIPQASSEEVLLDKSVNEKFRAGLTNSFSYKGISLRATLDLHYGGYMFSYQKYYMGWTGSGPETVYNDRNPFIVPNSVQLVDDEYVENTTPVSTADLHYFYSDGEFQGLESFIIDRSYLKLREVRLAFRLPVKLIQKLNLSSIEMSLAANNILLWTPAENQYVDPESTTFGNDVSAKFGDFGAGPTNQAYTIGLSVKF